MPHLQCSALQEIVAATAAGIYRCFGITVHQTEGQYSSAAPTLCRADASITASRFVLAVSAFDLIVDKFSGKTVSYFGEWVKCGGKRIEHLVLAFAGEVWGPVNAVQS